MLKRYLLWFCLSFVATAIACGICEKFFELFFLLVFIAMLSVFLFIKNNEKLSAVLIVAGIGFSLIWQSIYFSVDKLPKALLSENVSLNVTVTSFSKPAEFGEKTTFRATGTYCKERINFIVYAKDVPGELQPGDKLIIDAKISEFENSEEFAKKTYYKSRYVDASANASDVELVSLAGKSKWVYFPEYAAHYMKNMMERLYPAEHSALTNALILGDTGGIDDEFSDELRRTGMSHAVSVSGMHISFIISLLVFFTKNRYVKLIAIPLMFIFAVMVGATQSALRAAIMQSLLILSDIKKREYDPLTSISFAAFVLVLINPYCATDIAFLLSFSATLGIILLVPKLYQKISEPGKNFKGPLRVLFNSVASIISISFAASLFTAPITAYGFGSVSLIAPISNVLLCFLITALFVLGILSVFLGFIYFPLGKMVAVLLGNVIELFMKMIKLLSNFKYSEIFTGDIVVILSIAFLCGTVIYAILAGRKKVRPLFGVLLLLGFLLGAFSVKYDNSVELAYEGVRFDVLDVGQGQCIIATSGDECVVIDCGGENAAFEASSHLVRRGIPDIDALIITHAHADHTNGVETLVDTIDAKKIYLPETDRENATFIKLSENVGGESEFVYVREDKTFVLADMQITLITLPDGEDENENGLVVLVRDGEYEMLITGDIPSKLEKTILKKLPDCEAYIVGHHGSKDSSS